MSDDERSKKRGSKEPGGIKDKVLERVAEEEAAYPMPESSNGTISSKYIDQCLHAGELGLGLLYATLQKERFFFNNATQTWFAWQGHCWIRDVMEESLAGVEDLVDRLLEETDKIADWINTAHQKKDADHAKQLEAKRDMIMKRIAFLRIDKGRNMCLKFSRTCREPLAIHGDELDISPWLLACANGVIDLRTGLHRPGRPDDLISLSSPIPWEGLDVPTPQWEQFLLQIQDGDEEVVRFVQRLLGYGITGLNIEHILPVFWGSGRNGKGVMVEVINHVLGPLSGSIQSELLLDQRRPRSSAGPSPDIMSLKGLRIAFASETDEGQRFSAAKVKWLTGGDQLVGRYPHDKYEIRFTPTHTLFLLTNDRPQAPMGDFAFWERLHLVPFKLAFVDREPMSEKERRADKHIAEKLKAEASGILAWLVRGCLEYQKRGLDPPLAVREATIEYRQDEDLIGTFIEEFCIVDPYADGQASELYDKFTLWFKENVSKKGKFTQRRFGTLLGKRFEKHKINGVVHYKGVELDPKAPPLFDEKGAGTGGDEDSP